MFRSVFKDLRHLERVESQEGNHTLRLWDSFRDHAYMWRALTILLLPISLLAGVGVVVMYLTADTLIEVPQKRAPQMYRVKSLPDRPFSDIGREVINLYASYTPERAPAQFEAVRSYLWEPGLSQFDDQIMNRELQTVKETRRTQLFVMDPNLTRVDRSMEEDESGGNGYVTVRIVGTRQKLIGKEMLPDDAAAFYIRMTTIPRSMLNEYGIVITDFRMRGLSSIQVILDEDRKEYVDRIKERRRENRLGGRPRS